VKDFEITLKVRYAETDQMGIVYYANYFIWMEVARTSWFQHICNKDYGRLETEDGILLPVIEANCKYKSAIRYPDEVKIKLTPSIQKRLYIEFDYQIIAREKLCAQGFTKHILMDRQFKPIRPLPKFITEAVKQ